MLEIFKFFNVVSHMLFRAKDNTAKWKGRNLFSHSVSVMSQVAFTKRVLALVRVKLWPPFIAHLSQVQPQGSMLLRSQNYS